MRRDGTAPWSSASSGHIDITLKADASDPRPGFADRSETDEQDSSIQGTPAPIVLQMPWTPTSASARKGIAWKPSTVPNLDAETIETLLTAIAKARAWMSDLAEV